MVNESVNGFSDQMKKKLLITGVTGFVGKNLLLYLKNSNEYEITGISRKKSKLENLKSVLDHGITYEELFEQKESYDCVIHLAGQVIKISENQSSDRQYRDANFELTKKIYRHFLNDLNSEKFIFLSSIHVLTEAPDCVIDENYIPAPFTPYGRSKFDAEQYIKSTDHTGKKIYILRPTMIHGPGNKGNLKSLYNYLNSGYPYLFGAANNKRSFLSIENLCFVLKEIVDNDIEGGLYHLADDEPTETHELIDKISSISGMNTRKYYIPLPLLRILAKMGNFLPIPFDIHRYGKLTTDFIVKNDKIKQAIGKPLPITSEEGMTRTIQSFIDNR